MSDLVHVKRALISVSDKTGVVVLAKKLHALGIEILSTGGTAKLLAKEGIPIQLVSDYTGSPEIMDGRVKTLHPKIHGALLGRPGTDTAVMKEHSITPIQLLVVNLYPFEEVISKPDCDFATAIENIDIGGPCMLRAAAKNHNSLTVAIEPADYDAILSDMTSNDGSISFNTRLKMAKKTFAHTARYDAAIANYLNALSEDKTSTDKFPDIFSLQFRKQQNLRYGENAHQDAALYIDNSAHTASVAGAKQLQGKPLSFNNIADADTALECVNAFKDNTACVIVKHANPCGVALADTPLKAYERAFATDPTSSFGGIIAFNKILDKETVSAIVEKQFVEVLIAPAVADDALPILAQKPNVRLLVSGPCPSEPSLAFDYKRVTGGLLIQDKDIITFDTNKLRVVSKRQPTEKEYQDLLFTWVVAKYVKSNAIVYGKDNATVGVGAGQMSRVYSAKIAGIKAQAEGLVVEGAVMASDAFFPFRDGIDAAAEAGITAIIQPGGSIRDAEIIQAADEAKIAMIFTDIRHFKH